MQKYVLAIPMVVLLLGADQANKGSKKELKKFQGTWVAVSLEVNGTGAKEGAKDFKATIKGNQITIKQGQKSGKATFTIDPSKNPKWLDATAKQGAEEVKSLGIYKFDGDKLTVVYAHGDAKRPKKFSSKGGTKEAPVFMVVYKKGKSE
jgi:uncharacterized protein (TIGR03067 family)